MRRLSALVGLAAALAAGAVVLGVETHLFPGADTVVGVLGALGIAWWSASASRRSLLAVMSSGWTWRRA